METDSPPTSLRFAAAARLLGDIARRLGLIVPAFRSPPRVVGRSRTIRRRSDGSATVSVVLRDRPWPAVLADMVEGVVAANSLRDAEADRARDRLWGGLEAADPGPPVHARDAA